VGHLVQPPWCVVCTPSLSVGGFSSPLRGVHLSLHPQQVQEGSREGETEKGGRGKQERRRDKVVGTEYVLRPRQGKDREEVQPGRRLGKGKVK